MTWLAFLQDTVSYAITGTSASSVALSFFYIDTTRGVIYLRRPLTDTTVRQFTVSSLLSPHAAADGRSGRGCAHACARV